MGPAHFHCATLLLNTVHVYSNLYFSNKKYLIKQYSRAWFRSTDLWVMGPARFHCATLLLNISVYMSTLILSKNWNGYMKEKTQLHQQQMIEDILIYKLHILLKNNHSRAWFRSTDLWVMGPARFHCATLLVYISLYNFPQYMSTLIWAKVIISNLDAAFRKSQMKLTFVLTK